MDKGTNSPPDHQHSGVVLGAIILAVVCFFVVYLFPKIAGLVIGIMIGLFLILFLLPLLPTAIARLANKPNRYRPENAKERNYPKSEFGFFTKVSPGQVKIIEMGGRFIRCMMRFNGHTFRGIQEEDIEESSSDFWEVVETDVENGKNDVHPVLPPRLFRDEKEFVLEVVFLVLIPLRWAWWAWKRWVYGITGYVFIGVYPWRKVRVYPIERFKKEKLPSGAEEIVRIEDFSDHYRVADFQFPIMIPEADTSDKIPVSMFIDGIVRVYNPYETAYGTDDWSSRYSAAVADAVTRFTRPRLLDEVLSASKETVGDLTKCILKIGKRTKKRGRSNKGILAFGLEQRQVLVSDISPTEPKGDTAKKLADVAIARVDNIAKAERAKGDASQLREQITAVREGGHIGLAVLAAERNVRTAQVAGSKAIVVLGGGGDADPIQAAMLHELKELGAKTPSTKVEVKDGNS